MIALVVAAALNCPHQPIIKPRPVYTRQQRLKDAFDDLSKKAISYQYLYEPQKR